MRTSHTSHNPAGCFSGCRTLPKPLFLGSGSLLHGNHFGCSRCVPRWYPRLRPHSATLRNAVWPPGFLLTFELLIWAHGTIPRVFSAEGRVSACLGTRLLSLALLSVRRTRLSLPRRCLTVSIAGRSWMVRQTLAPSILVPRVLFSCCSSSRWSMSSSECPQKPFLPGRAWPSGWRRELDRQLAASASPAPGPGPCSCRVAPGATAFGQPGLTRPGRQGLVRPHDLQPVLRLQGFLWNSR